MSKTHSIEVSERELALLYVMRRLSYGTLEGIAVKKGEPVLVKVGMQRLDLERADELAACLDADAGKPGLGVPVDLAADGVTATAKSRFIDDAYFDEAFGIHQGICRILSELPEGHELVAPLSELVERADEHTARIHAVVNPSD